MAVCEIICYLYADDTRARRLGTGCAGQVLMIYDRMLHVVEI